MKHFQKMLMKLRKPALISLSIALAVTAYRCRDIVEYTKMHLTYEPKMYMGSMEPKFPSWFEVMFGDIAGPDKNKNGIRDDVEIYMNREFKNLSEEKKIVLYNFAIRLQKSLTEPLASGYADKFWIENGKGQECIFLLSESGEGDFRHETSLLFKHLRFSREKALNNLIRRIKYNRFGNQFHGRSGGESSNQTKFDMKINLEEYCGFNEKFSKKIRVEILDKFNEYYFRSYINDYEKKYGTSKRFRYQSYLDKFSK